MNQLGSSYPGVLERILEEDSTVRRFVNLYVGDEDVRFLQGLDTKLKEADVIAIIPAVAGG